MVIGLVILGIFFALTLWAAWQTWQETDVLDEEWISESDPRRSWRRI